MTTVYWAFKRGGTNNRNIEALYISDTDKPATITAGHIFYKYSADIGSIYTATIQAFSLFEGGSSIANCAVLSFPSNTEFISANLNDDLVVQGFGLFTTTNPLKLILKLTTTNAMGVNFNGTTATSFFDFKNLANDGTLGAAGSGSRCSIVGFDFTSATYAYDSNTIIPDSFFWNNLAMEYIGMPKNANGRLGNISNGFNYSTMFKGLTNLKMLELPATITSVDEDCFNVSLDSKLQNFRDIKVSNNITLGNNSLRSLLLTKPSILNLRDLGGNDFGKLMVAGLTYKQVYDAITCFGENTKIMCCVDGEEKEVLVQNIRKGTLVKTLLHGYVPVHMIGTSKIHNLANNERYEERLYVCKKEKYPEVTEDLIITGCHSILVDAITDEQRANLMRVMKDIYVTDSKYRLIASLDERAEPYACEGIFNIYHFALENDSYYKNYGVFANGLLVESCSKRYLKELSNMTILE
jgi:hypothetical protein